MSDLKLAVTSVGVAKPKSVWVSKSVGYQTAYTVTVKAEVVDDGEPWGNSDTCTVWHNGIPSPKYGHIGVSEFSVLTPNVPWNGGCLCELTLSGCSRIPDVGDEITR